MNDQILATIATIAGVAPESLKPGTELVADLGIDSPKALELMCELEDKLGIELPDEAFDSMKTVGDVLTLAGAASARARG